MDTSAHADSAQRESSRARARGRRRRGRSRASANRGGASTPLHQRSSSHFDDSEQELGARFAREGRVHLDVEDSRARARVAANGSGADDAPSVDVGLDWSRVAARGPLHVFCECPRFGEGEPCEHVWASLLALDEARPESLPPGKDRVGLRKDGPNRWKDLGGPAAASGPSESPAGDGAAGDDAPARPRVSTNVPVVERPRRSRRGHRSRRGARGQGDSRAGSWRGQIGSLRGEVEKLVQRAERSDDSRSPLPRRTRFVINTTASLAAGALVLDIFSVRPGGGRHAPKLRPTALDPDDLERFLSGETNHSRRTPPIVSALDSEPPGGRNRQTRGRRGGHGAQDRSTVRRFRLPDQLFDSVLPALCEREALGWWDGRSLGDRRLLAWDGGQPWRLELRLEVTAGKARLRATLERDDESVPLDAPLLVLPAGSPNGSGVGSALVLFPDTLARLTTADARALHWIEVLRDTDEIVLPKEDLAEALASLLEIPGVPPIETPEDLQLSEEQAPLVPRLLLEPDPAFVGSNPPLLAKVFYTYGSVEVSAEDPRPSVVDLQTGTLVRRNMEGEHQALVRLLEAGVKPLQSGQGHELELSPGALPKVAEALLADGWMVEVRGTSLRSPGPPAMRVESGIDWFELSGDADFAGDKVELKKILDTIRRGDRFVELSDGSRGLLPESWLETYDSLAKLAQDSTDEGLRFLPSQALLVDAQLALLAPPDVDKAFAELRDKLRSFDRIKPKREPRGFNGTLREYQRDGLGWLGFLREFGLGGILADDMGLGKTVQVLALLRSNRTPSKSTGLPTLVVAPRSLVYNWIEEAERFTPTLKAVEYLGPDREQLQDKLGELDLVVTTYGTLRRDIDFLSTVEFDTVILDEAQAIKNRDSQSAKASRLLNARNRLALTGTPIENHLGELGSIFEFLNPGLLGTLPKLDALAGGRAPSQQELAVLAEGIRPFILRRTKAQVLKDLPPKTEQVIHCELEAEQRELYDKLRAGYQASLLGEIETKGVAGSAIQVLEALLRLRQVACHPGLVDEKWESVGSAKLESFYRQMDEVLEEGHKLIVFSQFTKLLAYVTRHLDEKGIEYAYLDGQTRDRGEVVDRFQNDPDCNVFVISLKAGGVGLNLTAAGYVFLLDPWWNPAVEAQAIDRAHRIGQTQPVFSYRLIARDTVEEKILELQHSKRKLADTVLEGEGLPLREMTAEDLRALLS
ncbi:MAG TPA: SNF2-related protein [Thermoanaerobaculia bacterium]|nr:SNF2-related protein [Thermoanaerobaculia bacterium]